MSPYTAHQYEIVLVLQCRHSEHFASEPFSVSLQGSQKSIHVSDSMLRLEVEPTMPRIRYIRQGIADQTTRLATQDHFLFFALCRRDESWPANSQKLWDLILVEQQYEQILRTYLRFRALRFQAMLYQQPQSWHLFLFRQMKYNPAGRSICHEHRRNHKYYCDKILKYQKQTLVHPPRKAADSGPGKSGKYWWSFCSSRTIVNQSTFIRFIDGELKNKMQQSDSISFRYPRFPRR